MPSSAPKGRIMRSQINRPALLAVLVAVSVTIVSSRETSAGTNATTERATASGPRDTSESPLAIAQAPATPPQTRAQGPEIDAAIARLRELGAFVREFHPRDDPKYWVQIISTGLGQATRKSAENFDDEALRDVEIVGRTVAVDLHLRETSVTSAGLRRLASIGRFSALELSGNNVGEAMIEVLPELPLLGRLALESNALTDDDIQHLARCRNLASVSLQGKRLSNDCLEFLTGLPKLEGITLGNNFTWGAFTILARLENLRDLDVSWQSTPLLSDLAKLPKLRKISLSGKETDDDSALTIATSFKLLEQAYLRTTSITNEGVEHLSHLPSLKTLTLDGAPIDDGIAGSVRKMKQLAWLSLDGCQIGDETIAALGDCPDLWFLALSNTPITDGGLAALTKLKKLHVLYLSSCKSITDESIQFLRQLPDSENLLLNVQSSGITEQGARQLQAALPHAQIMWGVPAVQLKKP